MYPFSTSLKFEVQTKTLCQSAACHFVGGNFRLLLSTALPVIGLVFCTRLDLVSLVTLFENLLLLLWFAKSKTDRLPSITLENSWH